MNLQNRRTFLATIGAAALGTAVGQPGQANASSRRRRLDRIGLQLYTVRGEMRRDFAGTLARVAAIGYRDVEFADYFGKSPKEVGDLLARYKLGSPSTHIPFANIRGDWARSLADARAIGHEYVTIPWLPEEERRTLDDWKRVAEAFNRAAADAKAAGLRFAYHNHDFELRKIGTTVPLEVLLAETDPALVRFQMDIYWLVKAGADPLAYLARYPGRFTMVHAKDSSGPPEHRMVDVGAGTIDFREILGRATAAGLQHVFVEHDQPADAMKSVAASYAHLAQLDS